MKEKLGLEINSEGFLRPVAKIAYAREKLRRLASYPHEAESPLEMLSTNTKETVVIQEFWSAEVHLAKAKGWENGLNYVFGKPSHVGEVSDYPEVNIPSSLKPYEELKIAAEAVKDHVESTESQKYIAKEAYENYLEEKASESTDAYIDLSLFLGESRIYPINVVDFFKGNPKVQNKMRDVVYEEMETGTKEALDFALIQEDENNGLAKMLAEEREDPPRP